MFPFDLIAKEKIKSTIAVWLSKRDKDPECLIKVFRIEIPILWKAFASECKGFLGELNILVREIKSFEI